MNFNEFSVNMSLNLKFSVTKNFEANVNETGDLLQVIRKIQCNPSLIKI